MGILYQVLCTGVACFLCMSVGFFFTWPSSVIIPYQSANTTLNRPMTEMEVALFGSLSSIGGLISNPLAGYLLDVIGRKYCAIGGAVFLVISWIIIATTTQVEMIILAMFISGFGSAVGLVVSVYIGEISQESIRGTLSSTSINFYAVGMLVSYAIGGWLSYYTTIYVGLGLSTVGLVTLFMLKETPMYLMHRGRDEEAAKSFAFYRNAKVDSEIVFREMETLRKAFLPQVNDRATVTTPEQEKLKPDKTGQVSTGKLSLWQFIKKSQATRRATVVSLTLMTACIFQGLVVLEVYAAPLFEEAVPNLSYTICSIIFALAIIIAGFIAAYLTDAAGRRLLMIYSSVLAALFCVALGTQLIYHWAPHWVTAVFLYLFTATYTCGAGSVPFVIVAEVFAPEVKSFMSMVVVQWVWLCKFIILFIFNPLVAAIGLGPVFYLFAIVCLLTAIYCYFYLPETKGLTLDQIQVLFSENKRKSIRFC